jgi:hypothetical protein
MVLLAVPVDLGRVGVGGAVGFPSSSEVFRMVETLLRMMEP